MLRGRKTVRADRRFRTGYKSNRAQKTISKGNPAPSLFFIVAVFSGRMLFIRPENTLGARERAMPLTTLVVK
jgi:hypothetical protein